MGWTLVVRCRRVGAIERRATSFNVGCGADVRVSFLGCIRNSNESKRYRTNGSVDLGDYCLLDVTAFISF